MSTRAVVTGREGLLRVTKTVSEFFGRRDAVAGPLRDHGFEQVLVVGERLGQHGQWLREVGDDRLHGIGTCIRPLSGQHLVEHDAQGVDVGPTIEGKAFGLFRAQVVGTSECGTFVRDLLVAVELFGDAEIGQLRGAVTVEQDVARLDVAVNDAAPVDEMQTGRHLLHERQGLGQRHAFFDALTQRAAIEILHRDEQTVTDGADIVDGDDVAVAQ